MSATWCGYIDMLATRSIALRNAQDLRDSLVNFHSALESAFDVFRTGQCYAFSDGAFFRCDNLDDFSAFYRLVRNELFQQQIFFRCSVIPGDIEVVTRQETPAQRKSVSDGTKRRFFSMTFGGDAARAYQKESEFKGVGCSAEHSVSGEHFVQSFFAVPQGRSIRAVSTTDVKYSAAELDRIPSDPSKIPVGEWRVFDEIVEACQISLSHSERVSAYYLSTLVTAIRSVDLRKIEYHDHTWIDAPYIFEEIISGSTPHAIRKMPGLHLLLLTLFDHLFRQKTQGISKEVEHQILMQLQKHPACFRRLDEVPDFVIGHEARSHLVKLHVDAVREEERRRRADRVAAKRRAERRLANTTTNGLEPPS